jgi:hypothetical protein
MTTTQAEHGEVKVEATSAARPWKARIATSMLLADVLYVAFNAAIGLHPLPANYSSAQRALTWFVVFSFQFAIFLVIGLVAAMTYNLMVRERGERYRKRTWISALAIATVIAAFMSYAQWYALHR